MAGNHRIGRQLSAREDVAFDEVGVAAEPGELDPERLLRALGRVERVIDRVAEDRRPDAALQPRALFFDNGGRCVDRDAVERLFDAFLG